MELLYRLGDSLRDLMLQVPLGAVRVLFVGSLICLLVWVLRLSPTATQPPGGMRRWDENLKIPATVAIVFQVIIYLIL